MSLADALTLLAFAAFGLLCWRLRLSFKMSTLLGLAALASAALLAAAGLEDSAQNASIAAFYFLLVGTLLALLQPRARSLRDTIRYVAERLNLPSHSRTEGDRRSPPG